MTDTKITITFGRLGPDEVFPSRDAARRWIMEGLYGTEGAESDHYGSMLVQLASGRTTLDYWAY